MTDKAARRGRDSKQGEGAVGRPRITLNDIDPQWKVKMSILYSEGACDLEVRCAIGVEGRPMSDDLFKALIAREPEFSDAVKEGRELSRCWWERTGREGVTKGINNAMWIVQMRNRFGFRGADRNLPPGGGGDDKPPVQFYLPDNGRQKKVS